jgi:hypothetical protein
MTLDELKENRKLVDSINWEMTPEEAIALHLEWGPLRDQSYYNSRDKDNETVYFTLSSWKKFPILSLVRRKGFDSEELLVMELPDRFKKGFMEDMGKFKGVYAINKEVANWLKNKLLIAH